MTPPGVVAVSFKEARIRQEWVVCLTSHLEEIPVVDAEEADPARVQVAVVGNPAGKTLTRFPSLDFVQSTWAGVDRLVDGAPAVPVARMVAPELTELMAEFVLTTVLFLHRRFPSYRRSQSGALWQPRLTVPARERRVGVLGFGELGAPAALALSDAGFDVAVWARTSRREPLPVMSGKEGLRALLRRSQILVNLLPLTGETHGLLDRAAFEAMPRGAALLNAARGGHVVEVDLLAALDSGHVSDAVLDVFEEEPLPPAHPYWSHPRVTVLPHVAAPSNPDQLAVHVAANIRLFLAGKTPRFLVRSG